MKSIDVSELKKIMDEKRKYTLLDVREQNEVNHASINPHTHIPLGDIPCTIITMGWCEK